MAFILAKVESFRVSGNDAFKRGQPAEAFAHYRAVRRRQRQKRLPAASCTLLPRNVSAPPNSAGHSRSSAVRRVPGGQLGKLGAMVRARKGRRRPKCLSGARCLLHQRRLKSATTLHEAEDMLRRRHGDKCHNAAGATSPRATFRLVWRQPAAVVAVMLCHLFRDTIWPP